MTGEGPQSKRAVGFFDGQNLYRHAKDAFGHHHPNYDPMKLLRTVCQVHGWQPSGARFYTGTPSHSESPMWHGYWSNRLLSMRRSGILVTSRPIRYHVELIAMPDGSQRRIAVPQEKGIDVRIAIDLVRMARDGQFDVGVIFSQDQDLAEVVEEVKHIARTSKRWIKLVSSFPSGPNASSKRGIEGTDWFRLEQAIYDSCLDPHDYRPKS